MRNLASIQKIRALHPIKKADKIEIAAVLGWKLVVKKGEFNVGDLCVYCEIDSILPETPDFEFLKSRNMRIRTIRLRGEVSQGICFPLSIVANYGLKPEEMTEGQDITEALGVKKYEPPVPANLEGKVKGKRPSFMPKSDETRVQVLQHVLDKYKGTECYITEKLDGSSVTYYLYNDNFGVCSRNLELEETEENTQWKIARALEIEQKLRSLGYNCAIQGEAIGEFIQKNRYGLNGQTVKIFNFIHIDKNEYASFSEYEKILQSLELPGVPVITKEYILENDMDKLIQIATAKSVLNPDAWMEGVVIRPRTEIIDPEDKLLHNRRVSFKVINPEFLISYGE